MAFEFKAHIISDNPNTISWSSSRDCLPEAFDGRVSQSDWESTYDEVTTHFETYMSRGSSLPGRLFKRRKIASDRQKLREGWLHLLEKEVSKYRRYGIKVSLINERFQDKDERTIGLHFDVGPVPKGPAILGAAVHYCDFTGSIVA